MGLLMMMWAFALGITVVRKPYHCPLLKWVDFSIVNALPSSFLRVLTDLGVMMPVIFVMVAFWATSMSYAPFFDDFVDILSLSLLVEMEDDQCCCRRLVINC
jgi:hypothetical protein